MIRLIPYVLCIILFLSCGKKETTEVSPTTEVKKDSSQKIKSKDVTKTAEIPKPNSTETKQPVLKWEFKTLGRGQYDEPNTQVNILVNGKKHDVQRIEFSFSEITKESYTDHNIPGDAITACRGWWAGAGIDYWITKDNNKLLVFSREIGETSSENGEPSDYEGTPVKMKTIAIE